MSSFLSDFARSVLIIDDNEEEIKKLKECLEKKDIMVKYENPPKSKSEIDQKYKKPFLNRKLIFCDFMIDESKDATHNISSVLRPLFTKAIGKDFGIYGLVMWTKHKDDIDEFKTKMQEKDKDKYDFPLFIISMDKTKYLSNTFDTALDDLEKKLKEDIAANFLINWSNLIDNSKAKILRSIFDIVPNHLTNSNNMEYVLAKMAMSRIENGNDKVDENTDLPEEYSDNAFRAFNDLLLSEAENIDFKTKIFKNIKKEIAIDIKDTKTKLIETKNTPMDVLDIIAALNSQMLIKLGEDIKNKPIIPGIAYKIIGKKHILKYPEAGLEIKKHKITDLIPIVIDMTPPCDFLNNKALRHRLLYGFMFEYSKDNIKIIKDNLSKDCYYKEFKPFKLSIENKNKIYCAVFDFRIITFEAKENLQNKKAYKILFRAKRRLFADILQKMSSYVSRLGLPIIE